MLRWMLDVERENCISLLFLALWRWFHERCCRSLDVMEKRGSIPKKGSRNVCESFMKVHLSASQRLYRGKRGSLAGWMNGREGKVKIREMEKVGMKFLDIEHEKGWRLRKETSRWRVRMYRKWCSSYLVHRQMLSILESFFKLIPSSPSMDLRGASIWRSQRDLRSKK